MQPQNPSLTDSPDLKQDFDPEATFLDGSAPAPSSPEPGGRLDLPRKAFWFLAGILGPLILVAGAVLVALLAIPPSRTNFLVLGTDRRPGESTASRTDAMLLVTIDPSKPYVGILSLPRDLWVKLPDGGENRINTAYHFAELAQPGSGPSAAVSTVQENFGVTVQGYVLIDFEGFVRVIDSAGGLELTVPERLVDYEYPTNDYGVMTAQIEPGRQHMDGQTALIYARIRHGASDFERAERQQQLIQALAAQLLRPSTVSRYPQILGALLDSVDTDLSPLLLLRLAPTLARVGSDSIQRQVLQNEMVQPHTSPQGASVLLPNWTAIDPMVTEMFGG